jgi:type II secretory pathway component PulF
MGPCRTVRPKVRTPRTDSWPLMAQLAKQPRPNRGARAGPAAPWRHQPSRPLTRAIGSATPRRVTPLPQRAAFYRALSQMLGAGGSVDSAIELAIAQLPNADQARAGESIRTALAQGQPFSRALAAAPLFPPAHLHFMELAEQSGQLDALLRELADFTEELIALRRVIVSGLALPAIYLLLAAFIAPLPAYVLGGSLAQYLATALAALGGFGAVIGGIVVAVQRAPGEILDRVLLPLPVLGRTWRELDYWNLTRTLALLSRTSLGVIQAVRLAADTCQSPRLSRALRASAAQAEAQGSPLSPMLQQSGELPSEMIALWRTGEQSGRLDETFQRLATFYAERCRLRLATLAAWVPRVAYFAVALYMVWLIFRLAGNYINALNAL